MVGAATTRFGSENSGGNVVARLLALTPPPEEFKRGPRVGGISSIETDVVNAGLTGRGTLDPEIAATEYIGIRRALGHGFSDQVA